MKRRKIKLKPRVAHAHPVWPELIRHVQHSAPGPAPVIAEPPPRLWGLNPRTILSLARTVVLAGVAVFLWLRGDHITGPLDAALAGAVLADYLTWFIWSFLMLPRYLIHGLYEGVINALLGGWLSRNWTVDIHGEQWGELVAVMFVAFLLVTAVKIFFLSVTLLDEVTGDNP